MNLDTQDMEYIKATVKAAIVEANVVSTDDFNRFRAEVLAAHAQFYPREVVDLKLAQQAMEIKELSEALDKQQNILQTMWETAWGKIALIGGAILQVWMIWQLLHP